jgi:transcriptional regulator GlxA family with amidase domain
MWSKTGGFPGNMKKFAIIALDGTLISSLADLPDVAHTTNIFLSQRLGKDAKGDLLIDKKPARFTWELLSIDGREPAGMASLQLAGALGEEVYDGVFVPALRWRTPEAVLAQLDCYRPLYPWLRAQWQGGATIGAIDTGTVLLAEAGLLDGRAATTCRWLEDAFRQCYPAVLLDTARDITSQDRLLCGAALGLGTRFALCFVERFLSSDLNNLLEKSLLSGGHHNVRPPGVVSPGNIEATLDVDDELVAKAQYWLQKNLAEKISLADAASNMLVSGKTLARHFKKVLGITPHAYLQGIRIDTAKSLLLHSDLSVEAIAERVGYRDLSFFQQVFRKHTGHAPTAYRKKFIGQPAGTG